MIEAAWEESAAAILSGDCDLVVPDEVNYAVSYKMFDPQAVPDVLTATGEGTSS